MESKKKRERKKAPHLLPNLGRNNFQSALLYGSLTSAGVERNQASLVGINVLHDTLHVVLALDENSFDDKIVPRTVIRLIVRIKIVHAAVGTAVHTGLAGGAAVGV